MTCLSFVVAMGPAALLIITVQLCQAITLPDNTFRPQPSRNSGHSLVLFALGLGGDVAVAIGSIGTGIEGSTAMNLSADLLLFPRANGLFGGISLEGSVIATRDEWNQDYYGKEVRPTDILVKRTVKNPRAAAGKSATGQAIPPVPE